MTNYRPRFIHWVIAAILILLTAVPTQANDKVTICHVPPGNPANAHSITISTNALKAHLGDNEEGLHGGDYYGECQSSTSSPSPSPTPTPTVSPSPSPDGSAPAEPTPSPTATSTAAPSVPDTAMARGIPMGGLTVVGAAFILLGLIALVAISRLTGNRE